MTYYVGDEQQFYHHELDPAGGALTSQAGVWGVSNSAVASITSGGLASWLAPGQTDIIYTVDGAQKAGFFNAVVHSAIPAHLTMSPATVHVYPQSLARVTVTATDAALNPIADFAYDSVVTSDSSVATIVALTPTDFLVLGIATGGCSVTVFAGPISAQINVDVLSVAGGGISQADADARYRLLAVTIPDSQITRATEVDLGDIATDVTRAWTLASRNIRQRLTGNVVTTLTGIPVGEFFFVTVENGGAWTHHFAVGGGLPVLVWDNDNDEPVMSVGPDFEDDYLFYNEGSRVKGSRTWLNIPTT